MSRRKTYLIVLLCCLLLLADACVRKEAAPAAAPPAQKPQHTFTQKGSVSEITIWPEDVSFPEGAGKAEFVAYCGICHSLRYITTQPSFPRKTWEAEIHKMIEKYGAPIDSINSGKIVDYLVSVKGRE